MSTQHDHFLKDLTRIIETNLKNEQFGVSELAREMGMSRSHIHRQLKTINDQSVSKFIRIVRLEKAMEMLRQSNDSVSEIAYKVGFGSPAYFNHCFHEYFGYPPGEAKKKFLYAESNQAKTFINKNQGAYQQPEKGESIYFTNNLFRNKYFRLSAGFLLLICIAGFIYIQMSDSGYFIKSAKHKDDLSIVVLPFKNISGNPNNQYFAAGITEDILNNLYWITSLRVVSRTTSDQFQETSLSVPEIANMVHAKYVLEGSVRIFDGKSRISVQLIDAHSDNHVWSTYYDRNLDDIIGVQNEIALQVASKLKTVLSEKEIRQIEKIPTQNSKAYHYYLQGRFLLHKANSDRRSDFNLESVKNCIQYYEKAIDEDENFAEAYAGLANAWFNLSAWGWLGSREGFLKARELSIKALEIDPECAEAHAVLGSFLVWGMRNIEEGGEELKTSVQINPNFATARQWYAQFLMITGPIEEARIQVDYALKLEPYFWVVNNLNSWIYYFEEKYQEALDACIVAHDLNPNFSSNQWLFVLNYAQLGEGEKVVEHLQYLAKRYSGTDKYDEQIKEAYDTSGIDGLFYWLIEVNKNEPIKVEGMSGNPFFIAWWNAILGNKEEAIYWLEKVKKEKYIPYHYFNLITTNPDFDILRDDPRFLKIVDEIGLTPYNKRTAR